MAWPNYLWQSFNGKSKLFTKIIGTVRTALFIAREIEYSSAGTWNQLYMRALCWRWQTAWWKHSIVGDFQNVSSVRLELTLQPDASLSADAHTKVKRHRPPWDTWHTVVVAVQTETHSYSCQWLCLQNQNTNLIHHSARFHTLAKNAHAHTVYTDTSICLIFMLNLTNAAFRLAYWDYAYAL